MLYVVATPIGNLEDITLRAKRILGEVSHVLCEDTRVTKKLLDHFEIKNKKLISFHQHTSEVKMARLVELIKENSVALVTDAGTPGISDPGGKLVEALLGEGIEVVPIPGVSAVITILSVAGFPADNFIFKGFIPHKKAREKFLKEVKSESVVVVFYESPHRVFKLLEQMEKIGFEDKRLVLGRELTKKFETIYRGSVEQVSEELKKEFDSGKVKGEFVVVVY